MGGGESKWTYTVARLLHFTLSGIKLILSRPREVRDVYLQLH